MEAGKERVKRERARDDFFLRYNKNVASGLHKNRKKEQRAYLDFDSPIYSAAFGLTQ